MPTAKRKTSEYHKKQIRGYKAVISGMRLERIMEQRLSKQGYKTQTEKLVGRGSKDRFDVFGQREDDWGNREYCIVECKNKPRVTSADVLHFMKKLGNFYKGLPEDIISDKPAIKAILVYSGELPRDAKDAGKVSKPSIKFEKV